MPEFLVPLSSPFQIRPSVKQRRLDMDLPLPIQPVELVVLQGTSFCNLNCKYCDLSVDSRRTRLVMEPSLIERFFSELFQSRRTADEIAILWHSGEPLTLPPSYYDQAIDLLLKLQETYAADISLRFGIQTNGVLINDEWCRFFKRHESRLDLGVSCDGPSQLHDLFRVNWSGHSTHRQTVAGMDLLQKNGIKFKVIAVVTRQTLREPESFYKFFLDRHEQLAGFHFNVLADGRSSHFSLSYSKDDRSAYYAFYRRLLALDREARNKVKGFSILNFSPGARAHLRLPKTERTALLRCRQRPPKGSQFGCAGNVTTCYAGLAIDVLPGIYGDGKGLSLGNILETSLEAMARSEKLQRILNDLR